MSLSDLIPGVPEVKLVVGIVASVAVVAAIGYTGWRLYHWGASSTVQEANGVVTQAVNGVMSQQVETALGPVRITHQATKRDNTAVAQQVTATQSTIPVPTARPAPNAPTVPDSLVSPYLAGLHRLRDHPAGHQ